MDIAKIAALSSRRLPLLKIETGAFAVFPQSINLSGAGPDSMSTLYTVTGTSLRG